MASEGGASDDQAPKVENEQPGAVSGSAGSADAGSNDGAFGIHVAADEEIDWGYIFQLNTSVEAEQLRGTSVTHPRRAALRKALADTRKASCMHCVESEWGHTGAPMSGRAMPDV